MKQKISLRTMMAALFIVPGALLLLCSLCGIFFRSSGAEIVVTVAAVCMLVFLFFALAKLFRGKSERNDEMSIKNQSTAMTFSWVAAFLEFSGLNLYAIFSGRPLVMTSDTLSLLLASMLLVYGILFLVLDKKGQNLTMRRRKNKSDGLEELQ